MGWLSEFWEQVHLTDPTKAVPGLLPRKEWKTLNRLWTGHAEKMFSWKYANSPVCDCDNVSIQIINHILNSCVIRRFAGGLTELQSVTENSVLWMKNLNLNLWVNEVITKFVTWRMLIFWSLFFYFSSSCIQLGDKWIFWHTPCVVQCTHLVVIIGQATKLLCKTSFIDCRTRCSSVAFLGSSILFLIKQLTVSGQRIFEKFSWVMFIKLKSRLQNFIQTCSLFIAVRPRYLW